MVINLILSKRDVSDRLGEEVELRAAEERKRQRQKPQAHPLQQKKPGRHEQER